MFSLFTNCVSFSSTKMGASDGYDDGSVFCFNGPKTWQLGWFSDHHVELTSGSYSWNGELYGTSDYASVPSSSVAMLLKLVDPKSGRKRRDFYISFNATSGPNVDTWEGKNKVMVHYVNDDDGYSWLVKKLNKGGSYTMNINGKTVSLKVNDISGTPLHATVTIDSSTNDDDDDNDDYYDDDSTPCVDSSTWSRTIQNKVRKCPWFGKRNRYQRCKKPGAIPNCPQSCNVCDKTGVQVCQGGRNLKRNACNQISCCKWNSGSKKCESNIGTKQCF